MMKTKVTCLECKRELGSITSQHLSICCSLTIEQYKEKYPDAETVSDYIKEKRRNNCKTINNRMTKFYCITEGCTNYIEKAVSNHWQYTCEDCRNPKYPEKVYLPDKDLVVCQICFKAMEQVSYKHTYYVHGISLQEYRKRYPKVWITNKRIREERRKRGIEKNPTKRPDVKKIMSKSQTFTSKDYINRYPWIFPVIEKIRDYLGVIEVQCKNSNCKKWFHPTPIQMQERIRALCYGSDGLHFYCSDECKGTCPLYRLNPSQYIQDPTIKNYTDSEYQIFREEVLKRQVDQYGYNFCERCEETNNLHVHHEKPQKTHPMMSLDPDNGIILCQDCHLKKAHSESCSTANLAKKSCS